MANPNDYDLVVSEIEDDYRLENRYNAKKVSIVDGVLRIFHEDGDERIQLDEDVNLTVV